MSLRLSSLVVTLCLSLGFVSLPLPVQSLPVNAIAQVNCPSTAEGFFNQGVKRLKKGDFEAAINNFNEAIRLNPDYAQAYGNRGIAYSRLHQYEKAIADYNVAISLNPNFSQAISNRKIAQNKLRTVQRKTSDPNAIAQSPSNSTTAYFYFLSRGLGKEKEGDLRKAMADYNQALRLNPNDAYAYYLRGAAYYRLGKYEKAIADYNQALRLNPNFAYARMMRGFGYILSENRKKAIPDLQKAAKLFKQQGNTAQAQQTLETLKIIQQ